jgi:hypothetical protein
MLLPICLADDVGDAGDAGDAVLSLMLSAQSH